VDIINPKNLSLRKNLLIFKGKETGLGKYIFLPIGSGLKLLKHDVYIKNGTEIWACPKGQDPQNFGSCIFPHYSAQESLKVEGAGELTLRLRTINNELEWHSAQEIVRRTHYLRPAQRGMQLVIELSRTDVKGELRKSIENLSVESVDRNLKTDEALVIGCAVLDTLSFGNPLGRKNLSAYSKVPRETPRGKYADELNIAWLSRIALEKGFSGFGLGSLLVKHAKRVASQYRIPKAINMEVIRTVSVSRLNELKSGKEDFLLKEGFNFDSENNQYAPPKRILDKDGFLTPSNLVDGFGGEANRKVYYYAENI